MRWQYVIHVIGVLIASTGMTMVFPLLFSLYYDDGATLGLGLSMVITVGTGLLMHFLCRDENASKNLSHREGMAIVALGWLAAGVFGGLPFYLTGTFPEIVDCVFESISGFSTTGSSVMTDIESTAKGVLFWRSLTHWLGGMGIIVLSLAILPFLGVGGMQLYKAEVPGPAPDKLKPRIKDTAMILWKVYLFFSVVLTVLLMLGGMDFFDSLCHTFGTMATGGFSTKNASVAAFQSGYIDYVITLFMVIAGINFSLHYLALMGKPLVFWQDPECRFYLILSGVFMVIITIATTLSGNYANPLEAFRYASFQVASILTTTGFASADYEIWPAVTQAILLFCMFVGGCAGSTGGGMKVMRIMLLAKHSYTELMRLIHPRSVVRVKVGGGVVAPDVVSGVFGFAVLWIGLLAVCACVVAATGVDVVTSFAAALACIGNIGPGIGNVGPTDNYAFLPDLAKWMLTFCMLLGRLEIYTVVVLCVPEFWRK
ncbi:MAG: TrkH family potassium uptake protein [Desulfovibrio sp.]